jgi:hypothetical protein
MYYIMNEQNEETNESIDPVFLDIQGIQECAVEVQEKSSNQQYRK